MVFHKVSHKLPQITNREKSGRLSTASSSIDKKSNFISSLVFDNRTQSNYMEEHLLPSIRDMYNCTRENHDYNAIKAYEGPHKNFAINSKPTKKDHYLDQAIKLNSSPGPANNANQQTAWLKKNPFQSKRAEKQTYLDEICKRQKKNNSPSPNHYSIQMGWPKKKDVLKNVSEKTNFADTCQYYSDKIPGPGAYNASSQLGLVKVDKKKWEAHQPLKPRQAIAAQIGTYSPCPLEYNTFARYMLMKSESHPNLQTKLKKGDKTSKENYSPGPAAYSTVSYWGGKSPSKKKEKEINYFSCLSKGPSTGIYH